MRTAAATYRATSLEILKQLSSGSAGTHYVRCIRPDLSDNPRGFQREIVRQQLRALAILDTAKARQNGYSCRIPFAEFIRRWKPPVWWNYMNQNKIIMTIIMESLHFQIPFPSLWFWWNRGSDERKLQAVDDKAQNGGMDFGQDQSLPEIF